MQPYRMMRACMCVALSFAITLPLTPAAMATNAAFPSRTADLHGIAAPEDMPRPEPLIFADAEPAQVQNGPEQVYLARSTPHFSQDDLSCLAEALYHEARGEGRQGQAAVAEVILNRVDSGRFPRTVCGVINQRSQFSYTIGGKKRIGNRAALARSTEIARAALDGAPRTLTGGATYFHTTAVRPSWSNRFQRTTRIGNHIFYRTGGQRIASN